MKNVDVRQKVLAANERAAAQLRRRFATSETLVVNLISSPGSGKTSLLEASVPRLRREARVAVLVGDIATERDAERLGRLGIPARQILTGGACHLDARLVARHLEGDEFSRLGLLFIENVGNLICPTSYDLGEHFKVALLSVTEGDDKPFKYPGIFSRASATVITKIDLLEHVDFDLEAVREQISTLNPGGSLLTTSSRSGEGVDAWCDWVRARLSVRMSSGG